jgi:DNA-binding CsgD family transcriptional regulator
MDEPRTQRFLIVENDARYAAWIQHAIGAGWPNDSVVVMDWSSFGRVRTAMTVRDYDIVLLAMAFHDFFMAHVVNREPSVMVRVSPLSPRESQCLELAANGMTSEDIALKLGIKPRTANFHFGKIVSKLGVLNRKEAIALGMARGLIRPNPLTMGRLPPPRLQPK